MTNTTPDPQRNDDESATTPSADELQADIARTREQLGATVEALGQRLDVKARAREQAAAARTRLQERASHVKDKATDDQGTVKPAVPAALVGAGCLLAAFFAVRRLR